MKRKTNAHAAKLVDRLFHHPEYSLFDRERDPYEENDLADDPKYRETLERMKTQLHKKLAKLGDSDPIATEKSLVKSAKVWAKRKKR